MPRGRIRLPAIFVVPCLPPPTKVSLLPSEDPQPYALLAQALELQGYGITSLHGLGIQPALEVCQAKRRTITPCMEHTQCPLRREHVKLPSCSCFHSACIWRTTALSRLMAWTSSPTSGCAPMHLKILQIFCI